MSTDEQRAIGEAVTAWAAGAGVLATVRGADGAKHWREHWADLAHLGLFAMVLPQEEGTVADVATVLEHAAAALVPGPVLPTVLVTPDNVLPRVLPMPANTPERERQLHVRDSQRVNLPGFCFSACCCCCCSDIFAWFDACS